MDKSILNSLKKGNYCVHSVFRHTMNAIYNNHLVTFGTKNLSAGVNNIITNIACFSNIFQQGDAITVTTDVMSIGNETIYIYEECLNEYQIQQDTYEIANNHFVNAKNLIEFIKEQEVYSVYKYDVNNKLQRYQFDKIAAFLLNPNLQLAQSIVGLGMGLTPLGDDVLTGYFFAKQSIGKAVEWTNDLIEFAQNHTNHISLKSLNEITSYQHTDFFKKMGKSFFEENSIEICKELIHYGDTSGAAILTGFSVGILEEEKKYETI